MSSWLLCKILDKPSSRPGEVLVSVADGYFNGVEISINRNLIRDDLTPTPALHNKRTDMASKVFAERYHDISCGHRVYGHESKCAHLHGHNYRIHFKCWAPALDRLGRVVDFSVIKEKLCTWLEENWDHKMLIWKEDPLYDYLWTCDPEGVVPTVFNPTAENIGLYLLQVIGPNALYGLDVHLVSVRVEETRKCSAVVELTDDEG